MMGDEYRSFFFYILLCQFEREEYHVASIVEIKSKEDRLVLGRLVHRIKDGNDDNEEYEIT